MRLRLLAALLVLAAAAAPASAQIAGPPNVFVTGAVIDAGQMNANFAAIYNAALNRTGGTMSGNLIFSPDNTYDIGGSGTTRPRDLNLARNAVVGGTLGVTGAMTLTGALGLNNVLTLTSTTAPQFLARYDSSNRLELSVSSTGAVGLNAVGAGQAFTFSDGITVPAFTATGVGTISGAWTFNSNATAISDAGPVLRFLETGVAADSGNWRHIADATVYSFQSLNDLGTVAGTVWSASRSGSTITSFDVAAPQVRAAAGTLALPGYSFTTDPDSGIYSIGANALGVVVGGVSAISISSTGVFFNARVEAAGPFAPAEVTFAALPGVPNDGDIYFCNNCTIANPCAGAGTGAIAKRLNGVWVCN